MENQNQNNQNNVAANMTADEKMAIILFGSEKGAIRYDVGGQEVKLSYNIVRNFLTKGDKNVSDADVVQFMQICKYNQLNPFLGEAYLTKYGNNPATMVVSKEAVMKRAEANTHYQGFNAGVILKRGKDIVYEEGTFYAGDDVLLGGWCRVERDDRKSPIYMSVSMKEYDLHQSIWKTKPATMIRKVAIAQAHREAFPIQIGAMYTQEEQGVEDATYIEVKTDIENEISENANKRVLSVENGQPDITTVQTKQNASDAEKSAKNDVTPFDLN